MRLVTVLLVLSLAAAAWAGPSIVGSMNGWNPGDPAMDMTLNPYGVWELTLTLPAGHYEYKAVETDAWDGNDFPANNQVFDLAAETTVTFLANFGANVGVREGDEYVTHQNPVVVGNFMHLLGGNDWDPADHTGEMTDNGDGTYSFTATLPQGNYDIKVTFNDNWDQDTVGFGQNVPFCSNGADPVVFVYHMANNQLDVFDCQGPVATDDHSWSAVKGLYR